MSVTDEDTQEIPVLGLPIPEGRHERLLYLAIIMLVPALLVLLGFVSWMIFAALGIDFPTEAKNIMIACLGFLFGGGIAATVKR